MKIQNCTNSLLFVGSGLRTMLFTVLLASCSPCVEHTSEQIILSSDNYWEVVLSDTFPDGGSVALGMLNSRGEIVYLWAEATRHNPGKQKVLLKLRYDDPNPVEIIEGSELELAVLDVLEGIGIRYNLEDEEHLVQDYIEVLGDRAKPVSRLWREELMQKSK